MMNSLSALSLPFIICFLTTITAAVRHKEFLTGNISINCGSTEDFAAADGREWIGDGHEKISSYVQIKGSPTGSSIAGESVVSADQARYKTARISRSSFSYTFRLSPGTKFIRLHFNPGSYRGFKGLKDLFTVEAGPFTLLGKFSASLTADALGRNGKFFAMEFCINIEEYQLFDIIFYPDQSIGAYAFINGIELIAMPTYLSYFHTGVQVGGLKSPVPIYDYSHKALQVIHRKSVKQSDDYVNMLRATTTVQKHKIRNNINVITWKIDVDAGFRYLVRIHLCELRLGIAKKAHTNFKIFINGIRIDDNIRVVEKWDNNEFLLYIDYITAIQGREKDGKHNLLVTVESTDELELGDRNGPFKGFEILKMSNLDDSLANPNPRQLARDSPMQRLLKVCGNRNVISIIAISIIAIVTFKLWQLWDDNFMEEEREQCRRFSLAEIEAATGNFNHEVVSQLESALELQENPRSLKSEETSSANGSEPSSEKDWIESTSEDEVISEHDWSAIEAVVANGFSVSNRMGKGLFGTFYKVGTSELVAVQQIELLSQSLSSEISILHKNKHPNIFNILRNFKNESENILVFEFTEGKSLKDAILSGNHDQLSWSQCFKIIIGVARGINFLNQHPPLRKFYSSIDPCNIFLDAAMNPQLAIDYCGMPMKIKTRDYAPPEGCCASNIIASDIYGFGMLVLVLLISMSNPSERPLDPVRYVRGLWEEGKALDLVSTSWSFESSKEALRCIEIALSCTQSEPNDRLPISMVIELLENPKKELDAIPRRSKVKRLRYEIARNPFLT